MVAEPELIDFAQLAPDLLELPSTWHRHVARETHVSFMNHTKRRIRVGCLRHHVILEPEDHVAKDWAYSFLWWGEPDVTVWCATCKDQTKFLAVKGDLIDFVDGKILIYGIDNKLKKAIRLPDGPLVYNYD